MAAQLPIYPVLHAGQPQRQFVWHDSQLKPDIIAQSMRDLQFQTNCS